MPMQGISWENNNGTSIGEDDRSWGRALDFSADQFMIIMSNGGEALCPLEQSWALLLSGNEVMLLIIWSLVR